MRNTLTTLTLVLLASLFAGCAPEVGSEKWCEKIEDKPNGDWTVNEAKAFATHCVFENYVDDED